MARRRAPRQFPRFAADAVVRGLADTRVVVLQGARQVGKSTLAARLLRGRRGARWVTLDDPDVLAAAQADPVSFVSGGGLLGIDEIQRAPELLLPIKARVDRDPRPGQFLLTGSAHLLLLPRLADTLAGRLEIVELWPLSQGELRGRREPFLQRLLDPKAPWPPGAPLDVRGVAALAAAGGFPEPRRRTPARRASWFDAYLRSFAQRDVRDLAEIEHPGRVRALLTLLAARTGSPLNTDDLARDARLAPSTARRYLAILEAAYLVTRLPAWSTNLSQRVATSPKCHLVDSGLCAHLLGLDAGGLATPTGNHGPVLETLAVQELRRQLGWAQQRASLHHLRTKDGVEVDIVVEWADSRVGGVEVKAGATVTGADFRGLRWLRERLGDRFTRGVVLYAGNHVLPFGPGLWALPFSALWS